MTDQSHPPTIQGGQFGDHNRQYNYFTLTTSQLAWPLTVGLPPPRAAAFQERPGLRDAIEQAVLGPETAVVTLVVSGDGGTGKTQLAAAAHSRAHEVDLRVWVSATSRAAILAAYAQVADAVRAVPAGDGDARAKAFLAWLTTTEKSWLVVLDDVAEPGDVRGLWPTGRSGRVLVTTRRRDSAVAGRGRVIDVDVFIPAESSAYLSDRLTVVAGMPPKILDQASELAADLGHLPLALAQAAAVILDDGITCAAYRDLLADRTRTLNDLFPVSGDDYERTLAGVWSLAAERADALAPVGLARPLLALSAVLDSNGIPERVLTSCASRTHLGGHAGVVAVEDTWRALRNLHRLSLLTHDPDGEPRAVRMHALAQRATLEDLGEQQLAVVVHTAAEAILEIWPQVETDPGLEAVLRANVAALAGRHPNALWKPNGHAVLFRAGHSLGQVGLVSAARDYFFELTRTAISHLGPDHSHTLTARYNLAYWQGQTGDAAGARATFDELLADYLRVLGPDHPDTLATRTNLALWQGEAGDAAGASAAFEDLLADYLRFLGPNHAHTLTARAHLAYWRGRAGDAAGACAAFEELLRDDLRIRGPLDPETLITRVNVARWRGEAGNVAAAYAAFQELITDYLQVLGPDHPDTLRARRGLGQWQGEAGDAVAAAAAFRELLTDYLRVLGPDHPDTLTARANLARWRGQAGDAAGASAEFEDLLSDQLKVLGPDHPDTMASHRSLAHWREQAEQEALD